MYYMQVVKNKNLYLLDDCLKIRMVIKRVTIVEFSQFIIDNSKTIPS